MDGEGASAAAGGGGSRSRDQYLLVERGSSGKLATLEVEVIPVRTVKGQARGISRARSAGLRPL